MSREEPSGVEVLIALIIVAILGPFLWVHYSHLAHACEARGGEFIIGRFYDSHCVVELP